jgi:uncharacterized protein (TIGR02466 family)
MSNIENLFAIPVYKNKDYKLNDNEIKIINHICAFSKVNDGKNLTSHERYLFNEYDELKNFKDYCQNQVNYYAHEILKIDKKQKFYITQSWSNLNLPGTFHHNHIHLNSLISAVFFVTGNSSPIIFKRNLNNYLFPLFEFSHTEFNNYNSDSWKIDNTENTLLLFPSSLSHFVPNNQNDFNRISISFNTFVKGTIGFSEQATELKL